MLLEKSFFSCFIMKASFCYFSFTGNTRFPILFERNSREVSDSYKLPSPSLALPSHWRAAQPTHAERGRTQPLRGAFCSGPYGRLIDNIPLLQRGNIFLWHQPILFFLFSYFVQWPLCIRDHWDKTLTWKKKIKPPYISSPCLVVFTGFPIAWKVLNFIK